MAQLKTESPRALSPREGYCLAILSFCVALGVGLILQRYTPRNVGFPVLLFSIAVTVWYGGTGPGVLAVVLSGFAFDFLFTAPYYSLFITVSESVRQEAYWIGREALLNACRHSGSRSVEIEIGYARHRVRLIVRDDGCGIAPDLLESGRRGHWGLIGMRERAERIMAQLRVLSRVGSGTEIELSVPGCVAFAENLAA